jgi:tripartite-type tricarboxylate transporter receptor subunit TctC
MRTRLVALFAVFAVSASLAFAQPAAYPTQPIRIVVVYTPAGAAD